MKLHGHPVSGNTHRVKNFLHILGQEFDDITVDLPNRGHKAPEFLALNPLGQVPVLEDGDQVLRDSTAILVYLAAKLDSDRTWLPADPALQGEVQQWLSVAVHEIMDGPFVVRAIKLFGSPADADQANAKTSALFDNVFEPHLTGNDWLVGDAPTIADIACYSYIACVPDGDFDLTPYPQINAWLKRVEGIDGALPMQSAQELFG